MTLLTWPQGCLHGYRSADARCLAFTDVRQLALETPTNQRQGRIMGFSGGRGCSRGGYRRMMARTATPLLHVLRRQLRSHKSCIHVCAAGKMRAAADGEPLAGPDTMCRRWRRQRVGAPADSVALVS